VDRVTRKRQQRFDATAWRVRVVYPGGAVDLIECPTEAAAQQEVEELLQSLPGLAGAEALPMRPALPSGLDGPEV
jgi:hypothetical protein